MNFGSFAGRGLVFEAASGQNGALFHAQKTQTPAAYGLIVDGINVKTDAIVTDQQIEVPVGAMQVNSDGMGFGMFNDIVHGFLSDTKAFGFNEGIQPVFERVGTHFSVETG